MRPLKGNDAFGVVRPIAYCERGAFTKDVKKLRSCRAIDLIQFPYDDHDRKWHHTRRIGFARPSLVTLDTTQIYFSDPFLISEMIGSDRFDCISAILGVGNRSHDVRHFDSAYKSDAAMFITADRNYYDHADALYELTGVRVLYIHSVGFLEEAKYIIAAHQRRSSRAEEAQIT